MRRYRPIKLVLPDYEEVEGLVKTNEKPDYKLWYDEPASPAKLFRLLLFISNDGRHTSLGVGESSRSVKCLAVWLSQFNNRRWETPHESTVKSWIRRLESKGLITRTSVDQRSVLCVKGFEKIVFLGKEKEVCGKEPSTNLRPTLDPLQNAGLGDIEKGIFRRTRSITRDNILLPNGNNILATHKFTEESFEVRLSKELFYKLKDLYDGTKEPDFQKWALHVDRIIRIDKREPNEIQKVMQWAMLDSFWQTNIRSTKKLREKYPTLYSQMNRKKAANDKKQRDREFYDDIIGNRQNNQNDLVI